MPKFAYAGVDLDDVTMSVQYLDVDGNVLYEDAYTYLDLVLALVGTDAA